MNFLSLPDSAIAGLPGGAGFALVGVGIVLLYRVSGVISFAQGGLGIFGAMLFSQLSNQGWPWLAALAVGIAASTALGTSVGILMAKWFLDTSIVIKSALTIAIAVTLTTLATRLWEKSVGTFPFLVQGFNVQVGSVTIPGNTVIGVALAVLIAAAVAAIVRFTRLGVLTRAVSERAPTAALLGVRVSGLTVGVWALNGALAAVALIIIAPTKQADAGTLSATLVEALAAALLAGFNRLDLVVIGGLLIGIVEGVLFSDPSLGTYAQLVPLIAIVIVLMWKRRGEVWDVAR